MALCCLFMGLEPMAAKWYHVRSANFELYTDGTKGKAKDILNYLEQVRDLMSRLSPADAVSDRPVRIIAFNSDEKFDRLQRRGESPYAFFLRRRERDYIVFRELRKGSMYETALHEYIHLRVREIGLPLPTWLNEGMAEFYSTLRPKGKQVQVGYPPEVTTLYAFKPPFRINEVLEAKRSDKALWTNRRKVQSYYVRSWALMSLLSLNPEYRDKFPDFLLAVTSGESAKDAFQEIYGKTPAEVEDDVFAFLGGPDKPTMLADTRWDRDKADLALREIGEAESLVVSADLLRHTGRTGEAKVEYLASLALEPGNADAHAGLARLERNARKQRQGLKRAIELGSTNPYVHLDYAASLLRAKPVDEAALRAAIEGAAQLDPEMPDPPLLLAALARANGDHAEVAAKLRQVGNADSVAEYVRHLWRIEAALAEGRPGEAQDVAHEAAPLARTEAQIDAIQGLVEPAADSPLDEVDASLESGDLEGASAALMALKARYPEAAPVYERLARVAATRGEAEQAEAYRAEAVRYRRMAVLEAKRRHSENAIRIAFCDAAGWHEEARSFFDTLVALNPNDWSLINNRAYALARLGAVPERAVDLARRAVAAAPESAKGVVSGTLAWATFRAGRAEDAIRLFERTLAGDPQDIRIRFHYGQVLAATGLRMEALAQFDRILLKSNLPAAFRNVVKAARTAVAKR